MQTHVQDMMHNTSTAGTRTPLDRIKDWLNRSYEEVLAEDRWEFLEAEASFNTVIDDQTYDLSSDMFQLLSLRDETNERKLRQLTIQNFDRNFPDNNKESGPPKFYALWPLQSTLRPSIIVYPVPDAVITLKYRYYKSVSSLSADGDVPVLPSRHHMILVVGAWRYAALWQSNQELWRQHEADFRKRLLKMKGDLSPLKKPDFTGEMEAEGSVVRPRLVNSFTVQ